MKPIEQLASLDGVLAAGEFSHYGESYTYAGLLEPEQARMAAIMCRTNSSAIRRQIDLIDSYSDSAAISPPRGWMVFGDHFSVCVVDTLFCFVDNGSAALNEIMQSMEELAPKAARL